MARDTVAGRFFFTPSAVRLFRELLAAHDAPPGPRLRTDDGVRTWLIDAGMTARRDPEVEGRRPDGLQAWRCAEAYGYLWLLVSDATSAERPLPQVVAVAMRGDEGPPAQTAAPTPARAPGRTHRYDPDEVDGGRRDGQAAGRFFFPASVVEDFARRARLPDGQRPRSRRPEDVLAWLIDASGAVTRRPDLEVSRRDGCQVWRASREYGRVQLIVAARSEGELPVCVGVQVFGS